MVEGGPLSLDDDDDDDNDDMEGLVDGDYHPMVDVPDIAAPDTIDAEENFELFDKAIQPEPGLQDVLLNYPASVLIGVGVGTFVLLMVLGVVCAVCCHYSRLKKREEDKLLQATARLNKQDKKVVTKSSKNVYIHTVRHLEPEEYTDTEGTDTTSTSPLLTDKMSSYSPGLTVDGTVCSHTNSVTVDEITPTSQQFEIYDMPRDQAGSVCSGDQRSGISYESSDPSQMSSAVDSPQPCHDQCYDHQRPMTGHKYVEFYQPRDDLHRPTMRDTSDIPQAYVSETAQVRIGIPSGSSSFLTTQNDSQMFVVPEDSFTTRKNNAAEGLNSEMGSAQNEICPMPQTGPNTPFQQCTDIQRHTERSDNNVHYSGTPRLHVVREHVPDSENTALSDMEEQLLLRRAQSAPVAVPRTPQQFYKSSKSDTLTCHVCSAHTLNSQRASKENVPFQQDAGFCSANGEWNADNGERINMPSSQYDNNMSVMSGVLPTSMVSRNELDQPLPHQMQQHYSPISSDSAASSYQPSLALCPHHGLPNCSSQMSHSSHTSVRPEFAEADPQLMPLATVPSPNRTSMSFSRASPVLTNSDYQPYNGEEPAQYYNGHMLKSCLSGKSDRQGLSVKGQEHTNTQIQTQIVDGNEHVFHRMNDHVQLQPKASKTEAVSFCTNTANRCEQVLKTSNETQTDWVDQAGCFNYSSSVQTFGQQNPHTTVRSPNVYSAVQTPGQQNPHTTVRSPNVYSAVQTPGQQNPHTTVRSPNVYSAVQTSGQQNPHTTVRSPNVYSAVQTPGQQNPHTTVRSPNVYFVDQTSGQQNPHTTVRSPNVYSEPNEQNQFQTNPSYTSCVSMLSSRNSADHVLHDAHCGLKLHECPKPCPASEAYSTVPADREYAGAVPRLVSPRAGGVDGNNANPLFAPTRPGSSDFSSNTTCSLHGAPPKYTEQVSCSVSFTSSDNTDVPNFHVQCARYSPPQHLLKQNTSQKSEAAALPTTVQYITEHKQNVLLPNSKRSPDQYNGAVSLHPQPKEGRGHLQPCIPTPRSNEEHAGSKAGVSAVSFVLQNQQLDASGHETTNNRHVAAPCRACQNALNVLQHQPVSNIGMNNQNQPLEPPAPFCACNFAQPGTRASRMTKTPPMAAFPPNPGLFENKHATSPHHMSREADPQVSGSASSNPGHLRHCSTAKDNVSTNRFVQNGTVQHSQQHSGMEAGYHGNSPDLSPLQQQYPDPYICTHQVSVTSHSSAPGVSPGPVFLAPPAGHVPLDAAMNPNTQQHYCSCCRGSRCSHDRFMVHDVQSCHTPHFVSSGECTGQGSSPTCTSLREMSSNELVQFSDTPGYNARKQGATFYTRTNVNNAGKSLNHNAHIRSCQKNDNNCKNNSHTNPGKNTKSHQQKNAGTSRDEHGAKSADFQKAGKSHARSRVHPDESENSHVCSEFQTDSEVAVSRQPGSIHQSPFPRPSAQIKVRTGQEYQLKVPNAPRQNPVSAPNTRSKRINSVPSSYLTPTPYGYSIKKKPCEQTVPQRSRMHGQTQRPKDNRATSLSCSVVSERGKGQDRESYPQQKASKTTERDIPMEKQKSSKREFQAETGERRDTSCHRETVSSPFREHESTSMRKAQKKSETRFQREMREDRPNECRGGFNMSSNKVQCHSYPLQSKTSVEIARTSSKAHYPASMTGPNRVKSPNHTTPPKIKPRRKSSQEPNASVLHPGSTPTSSPYSQPQAGTSEAKRPVTDAKQIPSVQMKGNPGTFETDQAAFFRPRKSSEKSVTEDVQRLRSGKRMESNPQTNHQMQQDQRKVKQTTRTSHDRLKKAHEEEVAMQKTAEKQVHIDGEDSVSKQLNHNCVGSTHQNRKSNSQCREIVAETENYQSKGKVISEAKPWKHGVLSTAGKQLKQPVHGYPLCPCQCAVSAYSSKETISSQSSPHSPYFYVNESRKRQAMHKFGQRTKSYSRLPLNKCLSCLYAPRHQKRAESKHREIAHYHYYYPEEWSSEKAFEGSEWDFKCLPEGKVSDLRRKFSRDSWRPRKLPFPEWPYYPCSPSPSPVYYRKSFSESDLERNFKHSLKRKVPIHYHSCCQHAKCSYKMPVPENPYYTSSPAIPMSRRADPYHRATSSHLEAVWDYQHPPERKVSGLRRRYSNDSKNYKRIPMPHYPYCFCPSCTSAIRNTPFAEHQAKVCSKCSLNLPSPPVTPLKKMRYEPVQSLESNGKKPHGVVSDLRRTSSSQSHKVSKQPFPQGPYYSCSVPLSARKVHKAQVDMVHPPSVRRHSETSASTQAARQGSPSLSKQRVSVPSSPVIQNPVGQSRHHSSHCKQPQDLKTVHRHLQKQHVHTTQSDNPESNPQPSTSTSCPKKSPNFKEKRSHSSHDKKVDRKVSSSHKIDCKQFEISTEAPFSRYSQPSPSSPGIPKVTQATRSYKSSVSGNSGEDVAEGTVYAPHRNCSKLSKLNAATFVCPRYSNHDSCVKSPQAKKARNMKYESSMSDFWQADSDEVYSPGKVARLRQLFNEHSKYRKKVYCGSHHYYCSQKPSILETDAALRSQDYSKVRQAMSWATALEQPAGPLRRNLTSPTLIQADNVKHHYPYSPTSRMTRSQASLRSQDYSKVRQAMSWATALEQPAGPLRRNLTSPTLIQADNVKHHYPYSPTSRMTRSQASLMEDQSQHRKNLTSPRLIQAGNEKHHYPFSPTRKTSPIEDDDNGQIKRNLTSPRLIQAGNEKHHYPFSPTSRKIKSQASSMEDDSGQIKRNLTSPRLIQAGNEKHHYPFSPTSRKIKSQASSMEDDSGQIKRNLTSPRLIQAGNVKHHYPFSPVRRQMNSWVSCMEEQSHLRRNLTSPRLIHAGNVKHHYPFSPTRKTRHIEEEDHGQIKRNLTSPRLIQGGNVKHHYPFSPTRKSRHIEEDDSGQIKRNLTSPRLIHVGNVKHHYPFSPVRRQMNSWVSCMEEQSHLRRNLTSPRLIHAGNVKHHYPFSPTSRKIKSQASSMEDDSGQIKRNLTSPRLIQGGNVKHHYPFSPTSRKIKSQASSMEDDSGQIKRNLTSPRLIQGGNVKHHYPFSPTRKSRHIEEEDSGQVKRNLTSPRLIHVGNVKHHYPFSPTSRKTRFQASSMEDDSGQIKRNLTSPRLIHVGNVKHHYPFSPVRRQTQAWATSRGQHAGEIRGNLTSPRLVQAANMKHQYPFCPRSSVSTAKHSFSVSTNKQASADKRIHLSTCKHFQKDVKSPRMAPYHQTTHGSKSFKMKTVSFHQRPQCVCSSSSSRQKSQNASVDTSHTLRFSEDSDDMTQGRVATLRKMYSSPSKPPVKTLPYPTYPYYPFPEVKSPQPKKPRKVKSESSMSDLGQKTCSEAQRAGKVDRLRHAFNQLSRNHKRQSFLENTNYFCSQSAPPQNTYMGLENRVSQNDKENHVSQNDKDMKNVSFHSRRSAFHGAPKDFASKDRHKQYGPSDDFSSRVTEPASLNATPHYLQHRSHRTDTITRQKSHGGESCTPRSCSKDQPRRGGKPCLSPSRMMRDPHVFLRPTQPRSSGRASYKESMQAGQCWRHDDRVSDDDSCRSKSSSAPGVLPNEDKVHKALKRYGRSRIAYEKLPFPKYPYYPSSTPPYGTQQCERGEGTSQHVPERDCRPDTEAPHFLSKPAKHGRRFQPEGAGGRKRLVSSLCKEFAQRGLRLSGRCAPAAVESSHLAFRNF